MYLTRSKKRNFINNAANAGVQDKFVILAIEQNTITIKNATKQNIGFSIRSALHVMGVENVVTTLRNRVILSSRRVCSSKNMKISTSNRC